ncbi:MAG: rhomboid family intramembrane serine protease [Planctomycetota bacterium]|jgi:membrane associated rhomboid family serine protease
MRRIEPLTTLLIAICVGWTLWAKWSGATPSEAGAVRELALWRGDYWRLATHLLLHDPTGWLHLAVNMLSLLFIGRIVAHVTGRRVYLLCLLLSAMTGLALSLSLQPGWRMGISGGIAGLLGLLLAVEWAVSRSFAAFLKQRNTIVILVIVVVSTAFSVFYERAVEGVAVDHAAHGGGFGFGFLLGIAYYSRRRRRRPRLAAAVALLIGVLPIAYVCYPVFDPTFFVWRGDRAWRTDRPEDAAAYYERALALDPDHVIAAARLALVRDDPAPLEDLRAPEGEAEKNALLEAHLALAGNRLRSDPEQGRRNFRRALEIEPGSPTLWFAFAEAAEEAGWIEEAYLAFQASARSWRLAGYESKEWRPRVRALRLLGRRPVLGNATAEERLGLLVQDVETAQGAAKGLRGDREPLELAIGVAAFTLDELAREVTGPADDRRRLYRTLSRLFNLLAENAVDPARSPLYRLHRAHWGWQAAAAPTREVQALFKAARDEALEQGNAAVQVEAEQWFRARGLRVPPPDLAAGDDGG